MRGDLPDDVQMVPPVAELACLGSVRSYPRKTVLMREGEAGDELFVLLAGRVRIYSEGHDGRRFVFGAYGPGTLFGEGALDGGPRTASVESTADCVCAVVPYADVCRHMAGDPQFAMTFLKELIMRSRACTQRVKSLALDSVYARLRAFIEAEAGGADGVRGLGADWSQQEIANRLGSSRDMVTKIFRELAKGGYIETGRNGTRILKALPKAW